MEVVESLFFLRNHVVYVSEVCNFFAAFAPTSHTALYAEFQR